MLRVDFYGVYLDFLSFVRRNRGKLIICVAFAVIGCILGIRSGMSAAAKRGIDCIEKINIYLLISGKRSFFGYFISRFLSFTLVAAVMVFLSYTIYTAWINLIITFAYTFFFFRSATAAVILLKITFLPSAVLCVFPFAIIFSAALCLICAFTIGRSGELLYCGRQPFRRIGATFRPLIFPLIFIAAAALLETILACILTVGVKV